ncbi:hypothetical protein CSKR_102812 [Clonorchis sinensis]|uniref:Uncharacterized protein n=1 Tax=Clonorchis sinensis TaxID=79923 RepID=A0A3R7D6X8_CLOSI|nr:hypothetical protein CSKR_102812 [Clonorchis sinensis]
MRRGLERAHGRRSILGQAVHKCEHVHPTRTIWEESMLHWGYQVVDRRLPPSSDGQNTTWKCFASLKRCFLRDPWMDLVWSQLAEGFYFVQETKTKYGSILSQKKLLTSLLKTIRQPGTGFALLGAPDVSAAPEFSSNFYWGNHLVTHLLYPLTDSADVSDDGRNRGFTDSRIDTQERGFCPSFPGPFCSCRSAAVVHLKDTKGAWTTVSGRLFHAATTRNEKKVCLMKVCALSLKIFLPCPRRVFAGSTVKNLLAKPCSNRACSEKDRFGESQIPKSFLASILVMSSGPFSPCMTKEFAESPPNDIWTHFSSFRGRCQSNDHCFAASTSIWRALALELHDFKSSAKKAKHRETRFIAHGYETSKYFRSSALSCILSRQLRWHIQGAT